MSNAQPQFATIDRLHPSGVRPPLTAPDVTALQAVDNDACLFRKFRDDGDVDAFEEIFRRHRDALMAYLWTLTGNQAIAEDISQYCWMRLLESDRDSGYRPRPGGSIISYLRTLGRNRFIDEYKRKHAEARTDSVDDIDTHLHSNVTSMDAAARVEVRKSIEAALSELPLEQRDIISMWLQGFSINEMMGATSAPRDTVLSRKKYAIKKLKAAFELAGVQLHDATA